MGPNGYLAFDKDREMMACVWVTNNSSSVPDLCDVYISYRGLNSEWSEPINLTQTENMNENGAHLAPVLRKNNDNSYTAFVGYFYELGYFGPDPDRFNPAGFWVTPFTFTPTNISVPISVVSDYLLNQNYPNPFNPSTTIKYEVSSRQFVLLKVYDLLGREVVTLINEEKPAGSYEIEFDAGDLASGIYYYQLKAGDPSSSSGQSFIQTKKMILLK
ncbi:MAG: T9SS type A sorting domain-containing protein [Ignavibacteriales bacterium]|nr:MAG: T9SS type A sorting domain-containing protein [Ignavibacteriales bacterium]